MRQFILKFFGLGLIATTVLLCSCGPVYDTSYSYRPPASFEGRQCVNDCLARKSDCTLRCQQEFDQCNFAAQEAARRAQWQYRMSHHDQPVPDISTFTNTSQCNNNCGCGDDYNQCYTNCGGAIIAHTQCVAFCPKPVIVNSR